MRYRRRTTAAQRSADHDRRNPSAGYGLVEVLVSMTLFMIIAAAAGPGLVTAMRYSASNQNRVVATGLATAQIELARGADNPSDLTVATTTVVRNGTTFTIRRLLDPVLDCSEVKLTRVVTIWVSWPGPGMSSVRSDTIRAC